MILNVSLKTCIDIYIILLLGEQFNGEKHIVILSNIFNILLIYISNFLKK